MAYVQRTEIPAQQYLHECFEIRPDGIYWKLRPSAHFTSSVAVSSNKKLAGTKVIGRACGTGYRQVRLNMISYKLHRIAYKLFHGIVPDLIDHIDRDKCNNHPSNLREVTHSQNQFNRGKQSNNTSGFKGVTFHIQNKNWVSQIHHQGKHIHVGSFGTPEEAHVAYLKKAKSLVGDFALGG